jgi:hypothetical protein
MPLPIAHVNKRDVPMSHALAMSELMPPSVALRLTAALAPA